MASTGLEGVAAGDGLPHSGGVFVAVIGPSGAGKDTLIAYARARLGREVAFVRRVVTRPADAASEDHDTLDAEAFGRAEAEGAFALSWGAHGLRYGLPAKVDVELAAGRVAVANVSRGVVARLRQRYADVTVVHVTAAPERLAERLAARGRESEAEVLARLGRRPAEVELASATIIDNSGPLEVAGEQFVRLLRRALARTDLGDTL